MSESNRRLERQRILALLYEIELKGEPAATVLDSLPMRPEAFVVDTILGVDSSSEQIDEMIETYSIDWKIDRMVVIDRNILRIGVWELRNRPELSVAVIISEAVELAKHFSTEESGKFVNGILSAIGFEIRSDHPPETASPKSEHG